MALKAHIGVKILSCQSFDCCNGYQVYHLYIDTIGSSQRVGPAKDAKSGNEIGTPETYTPNRTHSGPISGGQDMHQASAAQIGGKS